MNGMIDISDVELETERLIIRSWKENDIDDFFEYASVPVVGEMAGWSAHKDKEESLKILQMFIQEKKTFAIVDKISHKAIGSIGIEKLSKEVEQFYPEKVGREIGYVLAKPYWGKGLMPEGVKRVIQYCFEELHYDYLSCAHFLENHQSRRVIEKLGFQPLVRIQFQTSYGEIKETLEYVLMNDEGKKEYE